PLSGLRPTSAALPARNFSPIMVFSPRRRSGGATRTFHILRHHFLSDRREYEGAHVFHINRVARHNLGCSTARTQLFEDACKIVGLDLVEGEIFVRLARFATHLCVCDAETLPRDEAGYVEYIRNVLLIVPFVEL